MIIDKNDGESREEIGDLSKSERKKYRYIARRYRTRLNIYVYIYVSVNLCNQAIRELTENFR